MSISFDDGYENVFTNAFPILKNLGLTATVFIVGDKKNVNRKELDNELPLLNIEQIKILKQNGWEIGYHTKTHSNLSLMSNSELLEEIVTSKKNLEKKLGFSIKYFAYPRGIFNEQILDYVKKGQYEGALSAFGRANIREKRHSR